MADRSAEPWYATAAYLYVLHLDGPALAWEYLRRHPDYRRDWLRRRRQPDAIERWGLRLLEDPALDAREAHPAWFPDHDAVVQLYPDADPPPEHDQEAAARAAPQNGVHEADHCVPRQPEKGLGPLRIAPYTDLWSSRRCGDAGPAHA